MLQILAIKVIVSLQFQSSQFYALFLLDICHYAFFSLPLNFHGFCATIYTWIFTFSCLFLYFFLKGFCSLSLRTETISLSFCVHYSVLSDRLWCVCIVLSIWMQICSSCLCLSRICTLSSLIFTTVQSLT